jgi:hypothetical protein
LQKQVLSFDISVRYLNFIPLFFASLKALLIGSIVMANGGLDGLEII